MAKFKVGDKVGVLRPEPFYQGRLWTVERISWRSGRYALVSDGDTAGDNRFHCDANENELAPFVPASPESIKRLDAIIDELKQTNPKDLIGSSKIPFHLWPETATALGSLGLLDGMLKYGRHNWRSAGVRASIYVDAARRHLAAWFEGESVDPDSGLNHLGHALACLAILVDAEAAGKLNDDRMIAGGYRKLISDLTPNVERLKHLHAERTPRHYTIEDNPE